MTRAVVWRCYYDSATGVAIGAITGAGGKRPTFLREGQSVVMVSVVDRKGITAVEALARGTPVRSEWVRQRRPDV